MKNSTLKSLFLKKKIPICPPFFRFMCITTETALFRSEDSVVFLLRPVRKFGRPPFSELSPEP